MRESYWFKGRAQPKPRGQCWGGSRSQDFEYHSCRRMTCISLPSLAHFVLFWHYFLVAASFIAKGVQGWVISMLLALKLLGDQAVQHSNDSSSDQTGKKQFFNQTLRTQRHLNCYLRPFSAAGVGSCLCTSGSSKSFPSQAAMQAMFPLKCHG